MVYVCLCQSVENKYNRLTIKTDHPSVEICEWMLESIWVVDGLWSVIFRCVPLGLSQESIRKLHASCVVDDCLSACLPSKRYWIRSQMLTDEFLLVTPRTFQRISRCLSVTMIVRWLLAGSVLLLWGWLKCLARSVDSSWQNWAQVFGCGMAHAWVTSNIKSFFSPWELSDIVEQSHC